MRGGKSHQTKHANTRREIYSLMFFLGERERGAKHFQSENQLAINISMYSNPTREIYLAGETAKKKKKGNHEMASRGGGIQVAEISVFFRGAG